MNTNTRTRIARTATVAASITAVATAVVAPPTTAIPPRTPERPCFIVQARWNTAIDGPAPTCDTPWRQDAADRAGTPGSSAGAARQRAVEEERARKQFDDEFGQPDW